MTLATLGAIILVLGPVFTGEFEPVTLAAWFLPLAAASLLRIFFGQEAKRA